MLLVIPNNIQGSSISTTEIVMRYVFTKVSRTQVMLTSGPRLDRRCRLFPELYNKLES